MKKFIQNNYGKIAITLVIVFALLMLPRNCDNKKIATQSKQVSDSKIDLSQVQIWKDKYNNEHLKLQRLQVDKMVLQVQADSLAKLLKIKIKQIQSFTNIKSGIAIDKKLDFTIKYDTIWKDGKQVVVEYRPFQYNDRWINIKGDLGKSDSISIKSVDTLTKVDYWKRKWFLGKKHYYSDFSNQNPYVKIQGLKQVEQIIDKKRFSIGPYIGVGYQLNDLSIFKLQFGVSVQYNIIQF